MSKRTGGFIGQDGINAPDEPTDVTGTAGNESVSVAFTTLTLLMFGLLMLLVHLLLVMLVLVLVRLAPEEYLQVVLKVL